MLPGLFSEGPMIHSFLLAGQSNMAGRGFPREVPLIIDPQILALRSGRWLKMYEPIICDRPFSGIGPGASFAWAWREDHPDEQIGLIPAADGGSSLADWAVGGTLFDYAAYQAELAGRTSHIDAILWHQGETDCDNITHYEEKFLPIISELRARIGDPDLPVLIGGLGDYLPRCTLQDYFIHGPEMNACLESIAHRYPNMFFVTAKGLTANPDGIHFNAVSQRVFGMRYYEAFKRRTHITEPVEGEERVLTASGAGPGLSPQERAESLRKAFDQGYIHRQEYDFLMQDLIREL